MLDFNDVAPVQPRERFDLDEIVHRLRATAETWVPRNFPNGRREGDEWRLANIRGDAPRKNGSCVIALKGQHAGDWYDHDGGAGGGPLSTLENATGLSGRELFAHAAEEVGWFPGAPARQEASGQTRKERDAARDIAFILSGAQPIAGTHAADYLAARGLRIPASSDLLFHDDLTHWQAKRGFPGMVAIVRDAAGGMVALHRTYLDPSRPAKADVTPARKTLGAVGGGAVRLAAPRDGLIGLAEGVETALAVMTACPHLPAWATLSTTGMENVALPPDIARIVILADHDVSGAGQRAAETAAHRLAAVGRKVWIALPPNEGEDFNDVLLCGGADAVIDAVDNATEWRPQDDHAIPDARASGGTHRPIGFIQPATPRPMLRADDGDLAHATRRTWDALVASNESPWLFRSGGRPAWAVRDDDGLPMAQPLTDDRMRSALAQLIDWRKVSHTGKLVPAYPPAGVIKSILATPDPSLPVLSGIVTTPVFGRNGELITKPGYHPSARLLYDPPPGFAIPPVPDRPSPEDIAAARTLLLDDLLGDFPFTGEAERAHALSLLLVGFVRAMIEGATPLHVVEKPTQGTGATLMIDAISVIATGCRASIMTEGSDDEEWRKRLTAKLRQVPSLVLIDNLRRPLDSAALAAALTAPYWEDRVLGVSEIVRLPIRCIWIATGNNPEFSGEMARRLVRIRLDARIDQPWRRSGFRHPNLMVWVHANRPQLVAACLTLCRAWIAAGKPAGAKSIGSFEAWSRIIGGILDVAGVEGFLGNLDELMAASDAEGAMWRGLVAAWWDRYGTAEVGVSDLYEVALACDPPLALGSGNDRSQRTRLGKALGRLRDRMFALAELSVRVVTAGTAQRAQRWRLVISEEAGSDERSQRSPCSSGAGPDPVYVVNVGERAKNDVHSGNAFQDRRDLASGERSERFSSPHAYADTHTRAHVKEGPPERSQSSPRSQDQAKSEACAGERAGERPSGRSQWPNPPDWLKEVL